jgi:ArsR family transcriptional regulator
MDTHKENARVFKAFCDENRLMILELLRSGEKCACVLLEKLDISQSTLSYHMKILCDSGIVDSRQEGKWTHYRISEQGSRYAEELLEELTTEDFSCGGPSCSSCQKPSA